MNQKQNLIIKCFLKKQNILMTGAAGSGKSFVCNAIKEMIEKQNRFNLGFDKEITFTQNPDENFFVNYEKEIKFGVTSMTGISAQNIQGYTLHSFLGIGLATKPVDDLYNTIMKTKTKIGKLIYYPLQQLWKDLDILIIDEISMMGMELFEKIESLARKIRENDKVFGGIQMILIGDLFQLPPVFNKFSNDTFCFKSEVFKSCMDRIIILDEIKRQTDEVFIKCLNEIRMGEISYETKQIINSCASKYIPLDKEITRLFSRNIDVDDYNNENLLELNNPIKTFNIEVIQSDLFKKNNKHYISNQLKILPAKVELCVGALVMLTKNMKDRDLFNGSQGFVTGFEGDNPIVMFRDGNELVITPYEYEFSNNTKTITKNNIGPYDYKFSLKQIPLKLAWAISIHKSQSSTLDKVVIRIRDCFAPGQAYTALSRVKNLEGLYIEGGVDWRRIFPDEEVKQFYNLLEEK